MTNKIKKLLEYLHVTQTELSFKMGISITNLNNKLRLNNPRVSELQAIADALGVELVIKFRTENGTEF